MFACRPRYVPGCIDRCLGDDRAVFLQPALVDILLAFSLTSVSIHLVKTQYKAGLNLRACTYAKHLWKFIMAKNYYDEIAEKFPEFVDVEIKFDTKDPLHRYVLDHSVRLHPSQIQLIEVSRANQRFE